MRVEIPPSPNVRRHDDDDGYPAVALSGRGTRTAPAWSDPDLRASDDEEDPERQGRATPTRGAKQPPRLRPDAAGGTGLRVVPSRVGRPNGNRVRRTGCSTDHPRVGLPAQQYWMASLARADQVRAETVWT